MSTFIDLFLHLDTHLAELVGTYGPWIYGILFLIVFAETGLVVTPFLPGDSLLFAVGAMGAVGALDARIAATLLVVAAVLGDAVNYAVGRFVGPRVFRATAGEGLLDRALNRQHLARAHAFFEKYGGKAVVLGRFVPIVRTFVPFVAGAGSMTYAQFALYNVLGALAWVGVCLGAGYAFGNVPIVKDNFTLVALGIVAVSLLPMVFEIIKARRQAREASSGP
ncbi:MAG: DedA family protein [Gemmatimonadetes bacterium]|nr:DedA family protein [Gemmatimonadota bacterium]